MFLFNWVIFRFHLKFSRGVCLRAPRSPHTTWSAGHDCPKYPWFYMDIIDIMVWGVWGLFQSSQPKYIKIYQNISKYIKIYIRMIFEDRVKDVKNIENKTAQLEQSTQLVSLRLKTKWQRHSCSLAGMGIRSILEEAKDGGNSFGSFSRLRKQPPSQVMLTSKDSTHEEILRSKRAVCWVLSFLSFQTAL